MIDKRVKNTAPARKRDGPRSTSGARKERPEHAVAKDIQDKPHRFTRGAKDANGGKPLHRKPHPRKEDVKPPHDDEGGMRIAKVMARAGLCSRRDAEAWIEEGRVFLNGKVLTSPAINIGPQDQVSVDGQPLAARERTRLFMFHKPRGLVTTDKDPEGRATIFDHLQQNWPEGPRVISIGRLDINTEGLLLLTNDGGLARVLELPSTGWTRRYRVRANGKTDQSILDRLRGGLTLDGVDYAGIEAKLDRVQGDNVWMSLSLSEGKNREIKRVLEHINLYVNRLIRISFGPFQLGDLAEGAVEEVRTRVLRDQLGPTLASEADADFDSPLAEAIPEPVAPPQRGRGRNDARPAERAPRGHKDAFAGERDRKPSRSHDDRPATGRTRDAPPARGGRKPREDKRETPIPVEPSFKPRGPRKHISAMRNGSAATAERGERKRTVLSETADRKGRAVVVERKAKATPRTRREEPMQMEQDLRKPRGPRGAASRAKSQEGYGVPGKRRTAAQAPEWQDSTQRPARSKAPARKPSFEEGDRRNTRGKAAPAKPANAKGAYSKTAKPAGSKPSASRPARSGPGASRPGAARPARSGPAKPGRPQKPR